MCPGAASCCSSFHCHLRASPPPGAALCLQGSLVPMVLLHSGGDACCATVTSEAVIAWSVLYFFISIKLWLLLKVAFPSERRN